MCTPPLSTHALVCRASSRQLYTLEFFKRWHHEAVETHGATDADVVATMTEYTAQAIADAYSRWAPGPVGQVSGPPAHARHAST